VTFLPPDFYSIDLLVVPKWGLYSNMMAQIISQLSSHLIIHYHRRIVFKAAPHLNPSRSVDLVKLESRVNGCESHIPVDKTDRLFMHAFSRPHRGESDKLKPRRIINLLLYLLSMTVLALVVIGCIVPSYSVNKLGIVGILIEAGQKFEAAYSKYSVFSTIKLIVDQASVTGSILDYIGLGSLSALLLLSVLVVPILQVLVILVQWFTPLTRKRRFRLSVVLECLQAWQYMEVFLLAVLIASWQLGSISGEYVVESVRHGKLPLLTFIPSLFHFTPAFLINPYCGALENVFSELSYYGILQVEDAQCFQSNVGLEPTFYVLFSAAVVLALSTSFVAKSVKHYFRDVDPYQNPFLGIDAIKDVELASDDIDQKSKEDITAIHPVPVLFTDQYRWFLRREVAIKSMCSEQKPLSFGIASGEFVDVDIGSTAATLCEANSTPSEKTQILKRDEPADSGEGEHDVYYVNAGALPDSLAETTLSLDDFDARDDPPGKVIAATVLGTGAVTVALRKGYDVDDEDLIFESFSVVGSIKDVDCLAPVTEHSEENSEVPSFDDAVQLAQSCSTDGDSIIGHTSSKVCLDNSGGFVDDYDADNPRTSSILQDDVGSLDESQNFQSMNVNSNDEDIPLASAAISTKSLTDEVERSDVETIHDAGRPIGDDCFLDLTTTTDEIDLDSPCDTFASNIPRVSPAAIASPESLSESESRATDGRSPSTSPESKQSQNVQDFPWKGEISDSDDYAEDIAQPISSTNVNHGAAVDQNNSYIQTSVAFGSNLDGNSNRKDDESLDGGVPDDLSTTDNRSVGSDHTPRQVLQMN
jgi:Paraquat-inducible protein A